MSWEAVIRLARSVLYEGYLLYPYRGNALKNQKRWAFGTLYPPAFCSENEERSFCRTELLVRGAAPRVRVLARFLHPIERRATGGGPTWLEVKERDAEIGPLSPRHLLPGKARAFHLPGERWISDGHTYVQHDVAGRLEVRATEEGEALFRVRVEVHNQTELPAAADRDAAYSRSLASTHVLLGCEEGTFVSQLEPPDELAVAARSCSNVGLFPVLVGSLGIADKVLASPIILYDHPRVAPESPGDLYDATEIDEILSLRILTLTDDEKREATATDPRARRILERTHALGPRLAALHGARRDADAAAGFKLGDRVVLRPAGGGDIFDLALAGERATICSVEESIEGQLYFAVTVDADPGSDLGMDGMPGHRFFFRGSELERLP